MKNAQLRAALEQALEDALVERNLCYVDLHTFSRRFKELWLFTNDAPPTKGFDSTSGSFVFLLQKNLGVTNASILECLALLRLHTTHITFKNSGHCDFFNDQRYTRFFEFLWQSLLPTDGTATRQEMRDRFKAALTPFLRSYGYLFETTMILDVYFTSIAVHIPKTLQTNIKAVCAEAGYIHSVGSALYIRNIEKASADELVLRLEAFLRLVEKKPIFVTPYADEFFTQYENPFPVSTRHGLDGVKIQLRKHFIQGKPLLDFLASLPGQLENQVFVPLGLNDFAIERTESVEKYHASEECSLWFITDANVESAYEDGIGRRGRTIYLLVYAQFYINDNQFIAFKERKPAWYASVTLPHTLSMACVNIVRSHLTSNPACTAILDPFCGTGTTLMDAALRLPNAVVVGFDRERIVPSVIRDNFNFFSKEAHDIKRIVDDLKALNTREAMPDAEEYTERVGQLTSAEPLDVSWRQRFQTATVVVGREITTAADRMGAADVPIIKYITEQGFSDDFYELMNPISAKLSLATRLLIYAVWRAMALGTFSLRGGREAVPNVLNAEINRVLLECTYLHRALTYRMVGSTGPFREAVGSYSHATLVDPSAVRALGENMKIWDEAGFEKHLPTVTPGIHVVNTSDSVPLISRLRGKFDAIITDPPYGFNTAEGGVQELQSLFGDFIPAAIDALKPGGQIILVLPGFARNGRQIPFFETQGVLVRQIISCAAEKGRKLKKCVETQPDGDGIFHVPIYWSSSAVLERRIIHFVLE